MPYQVLARKYRPRRFEDVVGQRGVTQTLRNAIERGRLAQAFVFAGPRGVGKTTTARILARALNCAQGPTPDPCGVCEACVEIAEGRDIDVLEIDAATHTQVDNVREVIISGLGILPVRDRHKIFIIDEVHQLSGHSFNALLKSIEEPPPHVVFMMATTELGKIPETILSRAQVYEFKTISASTIADELRKIAKAETIRVDDAALAVIARAAEGSMRDAQSAFDQVIAFAGEQVTAADVSTVLGLIGRDLLLDVAEAVANEDAPAVFSLAGRFVEAGYDLRLVCRELARLVRDLMVLSIDPARASDPEIAAEGERNRLMALAQRFSREDLLRAFDVLARAEFEIRSSAQPRYHLEMALLRWIHLRKLVPLTDLLEGIKSGAMPLTSAGAGSAPVVPPVGSRTPGAPNAAAALGWKPSGEPTPRAQAQPPSRPSVASAEDSRAKAAILAEIKRTKKFFYGTVVAQAQRIDLAGDRLVFTYTPAQRTLASQLEQSREWLEATASTIIGRAIGVAIEQGTAAGAPSAAAALGTLPAAPPAPQPAAGQTTTDEGLKARALGDSVVQAMLEVFPAQIRDVEEL